MAWLVVSGTVYLYVQTADAPELALAVVEAAVMVVVAGSDCVSISASELVNAPACLVSSVHLDCLLFWVTFHYA